MRCGLISIKIRCILEMNRNRIVNKIRIKLKKMNLITVSHKGDSQILTYSFQKDYRKWKPSPKKQSLQKSNTPSPKMVKKGLPIGVHNIKKENTTKETGNSASSAAVGGSEENKKAQRIKQALLDEMEILVEKWNTKMPWPVRNLTEQRKEKLFVRLRESVFYNNFDTIISKILASDFLSGRKKYDNSDYPPFRPDFDWVIKNDENYVKILEGKYDKGKQERKYWA